MRIVFIGCVEFSFTTLNHLLDLEEAEIVGVVTRKESSFNADFRCLEPLAVKVKAPCFFAEGNNQTDMANWIGKLEPDVIYCFGWSYLLGIEILNIPRIGVVGYHPAALPKNRGRHPIIWALALGLDETASTFFFMDEGADSGDILSQEYVHIKPSDDASTLYKKLASTALDQINDFTKSLHLNNFNRIRQDHSKANYWRKRTKKDGEIDWRMSAKNIHNLVRGLTHPYIGAHCSFMGEEIKIWKTEILDSDFPNIEPGKVLKTETPHIIIKCGEGVLKIVEHEFKTIPSEGSYL